MIEEPLQFGVGGRLFAILTRPDRVAAKAPVFVVLNAGLLHRAGPYRLHVLLARRLAQRGICSLRVDLGGLGDSLAPKGVTYPASVAVDFAEILQLLSSEIGATPVTLLGLCSGADNAIRLAADNPEVTEMVLLDPVCEKDSGFDARMKHFAARAFATKATTPSRYVPALKRRVESLTGRSSDNDVADTLANDPLSLRDAPDAKQVRHAFEQIRDRQGKILSIFTSYALLYYNERGQMGRTLGIDNYDDFASEIFWPQAQHTYPLEMHRMQLLDEIEAWSKNL